MIRAWNSGFVILVTMACWRQLPSEDYFSKPLSILSGVLDVFAGHFLSPGSCVQVGKIRKLKYFRRASVIPVSDGFLHQLYFIEIFTRARRFNEDLRIGVDLEWRLTFKKCVFRETWPWFSKIWPLSFLVIIRARDTNEVRRIWLTEKLLCWNSGCVSWRTVNTALLLERSTKNSFIEECFCLTTQYKYVGERRLLLVIDGSFSSLNR